MPNGLKHTAFDGPIDPFALFCSRKSPHIGDESKKLSDRHISIQRSTFRKVTDLFSGFHRLVLYIKSSDPNLSGRWREKSGNHTHGGGFARPVGAQKPEHLPFFGRKGYTSYG